MDKVLKKRCIKPGIERAKKLFESRYRQCAVNPSALESAEQDGARTVWDIHRHRLLQPLTCPSQDEFVAFVNATPIEIAGSPIEWWSQPEQKAAYPQLWRMAIDCLSAMPMSAASKSRFNRMRRTITWSRSQLGGRVIEEGECLKDWQRRGYTCQIDDEYDLDSSITTICLRLLNNFDRCFNWTATLSSPLERLYPLSYTTSRLSKQMRGKVKAANVIVGETGQ